jgi:hypothetical protein
MLLSSKRTLIKYSQGTKPTTYYVMYSGCQPHKIDKPNGKTEGSWLNQEPEGLYKSPCNS